MHSAQVTTKPAVPAKAAPSTAAPRAADPRGNNRTGQGKITVTPTAPRVSGSTKTANAIGNAVDAVGGFLSNTNEAIKQQRGKNTEAFGKFLTPSNPNAPIPVKQRERANTTQTAKDQQTRDAQVTGPTQGYAAVPGQKPQPGRPAPGGAPYGTFKGGVGGSGTATAAKSPASSGGAFRGGVGGATASKPASVPLPNGGTGNTQNSPNPKKPKIVDTKKPGDGKNPPAPRPTVSAGGGGAGNGAAPAASGAAPTVAGAAQDKGAPFRGVVQPRNVGGVKVSMPSKVDLTGVDQAAISNAIKKQQASIGNSKVGIKEGSVVASFVGGSGVPWNIHYRDGKYVAEVAPKPSGSVSRETNAHGVGEAKGIGDTATSQNTTPEDTTALEGAAATTTPDTPPPSGTSAADFVQNQLNNNPELGMGAANNSAAAALKALYAKTGMGLADENGQVIDPNTLLGGDPNKVIDWSKYTLKLAPMGNVSGATVTGKNYLDFQVNPNTAGGDTNLVGTALGNMILKQKQARADLLEQQRAGGTTGGGQSQSESERATTGNALGYTDLVRGTLGGGIADVQQTRSNALKDALDKMLANPEAYGYVAPPAATAPSAGSTAPSTGSTAPSEATPSTTPKGDKVFKIGETKKWGGKTHRWNGKEWITVKPKVK